MTTEYESQEFKANFVTACQCEGFMQTLEFVNNLFSEAEKNGREYGWVDDYDYYWLPEKAHLDYEFICPRFEIVESQIVLKPSIGATYETIAHILVNGNDIKMPFGYFHQTSGDFNQKELSLFAFSISYLRFRERDGMRNADVEKWNKVVESNIVSIDTVLLFQEDKLVANSWANHNFPDNILNAWIGKCGEFIFRAWASQRGISLSPLEISFDRTPDKYDFVNTASHFFGMKNLFYE